MAVEQTGPEKPSFDAATVRLLGRAERRLGELLLLARAWERYEDIASWPLPIACACAETASAGAAVDAAELAGLGPELAVSRPARPLRRAIGLCLAWRRLLEHPAGEPLIPSLVGEVYAGLEAPWLARGGEEPEPPAPGELSGAAVWTLAPRWLEGGIPPLWAAGLALCAWEREGPDEPRRGLAGRVLMAGLAPRLGLPARAFFALGPALERAARPLGGLEPLYARLRAGDSPRRFLGVFLAAVELSAAYVVSLGLSVRELQVQHRGLIDTWVRAPRHPRRLLDLLVALPVVDLPRVARELEVTQRTAGGLADKLVDQGILCEVTGQQRGRRFAYGPMLELLQPGWAPPGRDDREEPEPEPGDDQPPNQ